MGGDIVVDSVLDQGTSFQVYIPVSSKPSSSPEEV
jgi:signal transduction histidine kinase